MRLEYISHMFYNYFAELFPKKRSKPFKKTPRTPRDNDKRDTSSNQPPAKKGKFTGTTKDKNESRDASKFKSKFSKKSSGGGRDKSPGGAASKFSKFQKKDNDKNSKSNKPGGGAGGKSPAAKGKKKFITDLDKMRRSKQRKDKRTTAKKMGKRANKPRKC